MWTLVRVGAGRVRCGLEVRVRNIKICKPKNDPPLLEKHTLLRHFYYQILGIFFNNWSFYSIFFAPFGYSVVQPAPHPKNMLRVSCGLNPPRTTRGLCGLEPTRSHPYSPPVCALCKIDGGDTTIALHTAKSCPHTPQVPSCCTQHCTQFVQST